MSKFVSEELQRIDLGEGEWVKIPKKIAFGDAEKLEQQSVGFEQTLVMMVLYIKEWNFKDDSGNPVELNAESIKKLDISVAKQIQESIATLAPESDKKKLESEQVNSQKQSKEKAQMQPGSTT